MTRFVWLRQFEPGNNAAFAGRLLERLEFLQRLDLSERIIEDIPPHRVARLRRQGERHFADGLREMLDNRRLAILAVCAVEWQAGLADALVETHDRIVGRTWREAEKICDARIDDARTTVRHTLRSFADLGQALLEARYRPAMLEQTVSGKLGWDGLQDLVVVAERLTDTMSNDPLAHVAQGHGRLRRYAPRMLRALDIQAAPVAKPLLDAASLIRDGRTHTEPRAFLRPTSKWRRHLDAQPKGDKAALGSRRPVTPARRLPLRRPLAAAFPASRQPDTGTGRAANQHDPCCTGRAARRRANGSPIGRHG